MKRMRVVIIALMLISVWILKAGDTLAGDWQTSGNDIYYDSGKVGIGIQQPDEELHILNDNGVPAIKLTSPNDSYGSISFFDNSSWQGIISIYSNNWSETEVQNDLEIWSRAGDIVLAPGNSRKFYFKTGGKLGVGVSSPQAYTHIKGPSGNPSSTGTETNAVLRIDSTYNSVLDMGQYSTSPYPMYIQSADRSNLAQYYNLIIQPVGGNVGIGTTDPGNYKLAVEGKIGAREIVVTEASWSDFVFGDNYKLQSLKIVESFIKENKHLPDMPSAKKVEEEGLSMAKMMAKQMQKIEELTLYVIEQNKEIQGLKKKLAELEERK